jgi:SAM-dependent methyltransferase
MLKLNMGCGHNRLADFVNVDAAPQCAPDQVADLETTPWPWESDSVGEVVFNHSLEHMGADPKVFLAMMQELYRVMAPGGRVRIVVPHPRHDNFINDPTHVRAVTPAMLELFDRRKNDAWQAAGVANSPLAHYTGVDFELVDTKAILAEPYRSRLLAKQMTVAQLDAAAAAQNNVIEEFRLQLVVRK